MLALLHQLAAVQSHTQVAAVQVVIQQTSRIIKRQAVQVAAVLVAKEALTTQRLALRTQAVAAAVAVAEVLRTQVNRAVQVLSS